MFLWFKKKIDIATLKKKTANKKTYNNTRKKKIALTIKFESKRNWVELKLLNPREIELN